MAKCFFFKTNGRLRSVILTDRMILQSFEAWDLDQTKEHTELVRSLYMNQEVMVRVEKHKPYTESEVGTLVEAWIKSWQVGRPSSSWLAFESSGSREEASANLLTTACPKGAFVGVFMLDPGYKPGCLEIGYVLAKSQWNKGFGQEGARALAEAVIQEINQNHSYEFDFSFGQRVLPERKINELFATTSPDNNASIKILDRLGFEHFPIEQSERLSKLAVGEINLEREFIDDSGVKRTLGSRGGVQKLFFLKCFFRVRD